MLVGIPSSSKNLEEGIVFEHFGRAPYYLIINEEVTDEGRDSNEGVEVMKVIENNGEMLPAIVLWKEKVNVVIIKNIGQKAFLILNKQGIRVFRAKYDRVVDNIKALRNNELEELSIQNCCTGHEEENCDKNKDGGES